MNEAADDGTGAGTPNSDGSLTAERVDPSWLIVGVAAGGSEALEALFAAVPDDLGAAFLVVQQRAPDHQNVLPQLLERCARLPVQAVEDGVSIEPNHIYVIAPDKQMILASGRLLLSNRQPSVAQARPIDDLFRSLAIEAGRRAVAVVLSGTGVDGSIGAAAVAEQGGFVIAQAPESTDFDGLPRTVIDADVVDFTLAPEQIPGELARIASAASSAPSASGRGAGASAAELDLVFELLRADFDVHFEEYRRTTIERRLLRRVLLTGAASTADYIARLGVEAEERSALYHDLLIGVTRFFRDEDAFKSLRDEVLAPLIAKASKREGLRLWVAGCATGEEAYSIAMLLHELVGDEIAQIPMQLFATDLHRGSVKFASDGIYPAVALTGLSPERIERFFRSHESGGWVVSPALRRTVAFARHDVLRDPPFRQIDAITCRNLLIYLKPQTQQRVLSLFRFALQPDGALMLGPSESLGALSDEFEELDRSWRLFRKRLSVGSARDPASPGRIDTSLRARSAPAPVPAPEVAAIEGVLPPTYDALLSEFLPPSFLVDENAQLLHCFSGAERWLKVPGGRASTRLSDMLPESVGRSVTGALQRAALTGLEQRDSGALVGDSDDEEQTWRLCVRAVQDSSAREPRFLVLLESDDGAARASQAPATSAPLEFSRVHVDALRAELAQARANLQRAVAELGAPNEQLRSSNEELQSVNEELHTVNSELQTKIVELTQLTDDVNNLLISTKVGVVILDAELTIRRHTPEIARLFHFAPQDIGRRIDVFAGDLDYPELVPDLRKVLRSGEPIELEVRDRSGAPYLVRLLPYQSTTEQRGVVLTAVDLSHLRDVEDDLAMFKFLSLHAVDAQTLLDENDNIVYANEVAMRMFGRSMQWLGGRAWGELVKVDLKALLDEACEEQARLEEFEITDAHGVARTVEVSAKSMDFRGRRYCFVSLRDVSSRRKFERRLQVEHGVVAALSEAATVESGLLRVLEELVGGFDLFVAELWAFRGETPTLTRQVFGERVSHAETWRRASRGIENKALESWIGRLSKDSLPHWYSEIGKRGSLVRQEAANLVGLRTAFGLSAQDGVGVHYTIVCFSRETIDAEAEVIDVLVSVRGLLRQFLLRQRVEHALKLRTRAIEEAKEGLIIVDARAADSPIVYVNPAFEQLTGYSLADVEGRNCRLLQGPKTDQDTRAVLRKAIEERREQRVTILNYTKTGREFWNQLHISPVRDEQGEVTHFVGVQHDVTALLEIQEDLRKAQESARAASRAKTEFLANISHEIRTPLSSVIGFCDIMLERTRDPESIEDLRAIRRNGAYLAELIEDILDLARIEAGRLRMEREPISIVELVLDLAALMQVRAQERRIELSFEFENDTPATIRSDRVRVRQVLVNLIGNAVKFTGSGSVRVVVAFRPASDPPQIEFQVVDTGPGIDPQDLERIFEAFTQSRRVNLAHASGAGLGLAICRRLARGLGGDVYVESRLGEGSKFTLRLPTGALDGVEIRKPDLRALPLSTGRSQDIRGKLTGVRALVVDDIADVRRVARHFLEHAGALVEVADTGARALDAVVASMEANAPFDVVLMDIQLPDRPGDEVVGALRVRGFVNPVIAVTASAMSDERERWLSSGCDEVVIKPVKGPELVAAIHGHLARRRRRPTGETTAIVRPVEVLLAEDNADAAESVRRLFESRGAVVRTAELGRTALDLFREHRPELVVTDMRLADIDGCTLVSTMLAAKHEPRPLFVALSGLDDELSIEAAYAAGCDVYLVKPVDPARLFELIDHALTRRSGKR